MSATARQITLFLAGLALGLAGAWALWSLRASPAPGPAPTGAVTAPAPAANNSPETVKASPAADPAPPAASAAARPANATAQASAPQSCPVRLLAATSGAKDGQYQLQQDLTGKTEKDISAFLVVGKEAAASGRPRDAEVAFLMACRVAEALKGAGSLEAADAKYQLGWHYANLGLHGRAGNRPELLNTAERMYADSLVAYRARHGDKHEKTRFASEGLASLRHTAAPPPGSTASASAAAPAPAPAPARAPGAVASAEPRTTAPAPMRPASPENRRPTQNLGAGASERPPGPQVPSPSSGVATGQAHSGTADANPPVPTRPAAGSANAIRPSFDCAKARSRPELLICADPELARLDRDLGRLYARARDAAPDAGAFRRQQDQAWREREANCRDRECLLGWYAQRRAQLNESLARSRP